MPRYDEEGRLLWQIYGDSAKLLPKGDIDVTSLRLEVFKDGKVDVCIMAPQCVINQDKGTAASESEVRIERSGLVITGVGFRWNHQTQGITILSRVKVVIEQPMKMIGQDEENKR
ncbi:MAG: LPS export ABC transporter periplasmic protein LptC [Kiritimatiellae bacterium]|nr:LPS export ABC transporter periplasmic protein LptC [Kiritimatiellia bacterium]